MTSDRTQVADEKVDTLSSMLTIKRYMGSDRRTLEARLKPANRDEATFLIARSIVKNRCSNAPQYVDAWLNRYNGGPSHSPEFLDCLIAHIASDSIGTPTEPANEIHLQGLVAEHIWHVLSSEDALGFGPPILSEVGWSPIDHGGDGIVVVGCAGTYSFRLWESKAHTGQKAVRTIVNGACDQLTSNALRYLARYSKIGQAIGDLDLQTFCGNMPEMWIQGDRCAGGGVSVTTQETPSVDCFSNLPDY